MIQLDRSPEPKTLEKNGQKWLAKWQQKRQKAPKSRPPSSQYAHRDIKAALRAISLGKCFYCEGQLQESEEQVDHFIEVAEQPDLAFDWENLYLSCPQCNLLKRPNREISVETTIDPCDRESDPFEHLTFDDERYRARHDSPKGRQTIGKYQLNRDELCYKRLKRLRLIDQTLRKILEIRPDREHLSDDEREIISAFQNRDQAYSLMCRVYLAQIGF